MNFGEGCRMIVFIHGGLGSGKSLTAVWLAHQEYLSGRPVYTNFPCAFSTQIHTWDELVSLRRGVFVWDESHLDIDSRKFGSNVEFTPWLTQVRKIDLDLIVISQDFGQVDLRLRNLTDILIQCEKVEEKGRRGTRFVVVNMFAKKITARSVLWHSEDLYNLYDTFALVRRLQGKFPSLDALWDG